MKMESRMKVLFTLQQSNFIGIEQDFEINGGEQNFDVEDIEVFQIAFR